MYDLMANLTEEAQIILAGLFREIIQSKPPLTHLNLSAFSDSFTRYDSTRYDSIGEIIFEALYSS